MDNKKHTLYSDDQTVLACSICACRYPETRRKLTNELHPEPVCSERCMGLLRKQEKAQEELLQHPV